ncbi:hypothetical protein BKA69DRAFT_144822 [Paraphysoderma sedebokerense]|nr:hypothetical protein BKA69DRAFT_144822 [Paraphysoderma sedebokerense]
MSLPLQMWNLIFFSGLFIYRYRRKLQNTFRTSRFYKTVLDISVQNAILPTIVVIPAVITNFLFPEPIILMVNGVLTTLFRFILTVVIANSLNLINLRNYSGKNSQTMTTRNHATRLTSLHLVSSFGLEHRADIVLENFLLGLHSILGGEKGYFVERNRNGQMNLVCAFSFESCRAEESEKVTLISANDATKIEKVPIAALEYALDQAYPILFDLDMETEENASIRCFLGDQIEYVNSVFILPITSPESGKQKTIYVEKYVFASMKCVDKNTYSYLILANLALKAAGWSTFEFSNCCLSI